FDHAQPKARLEDLVRRYGVREGVVSIAQHQPSASISASQQRADGSASPSVKSSPAQSTANLIVNTAAANTNTPPLSPSSPLTPSTPTQSQSSRFSTSRFLSSLFSSSNNTTKPSTIPTPYPPPQTQTRIKIKPIQFSRISISLAPRTISLFVGFGVNR